MCVSLPTSALEKMIVLCEIIENINSKRIAILKFPIPWLKFFLFFNPN